MIKVDRGSTRQGRRFAGPCLPILLLTACASAPPPAPPAPEPPPPPARDWVREIRAEAMDLGRRGGVFPLQDADVKALHADALKAERAANWAEAERLLTEALSLNPNDPGLWQSRAEIALAKRDFSNAEAHARKADALGIDFGELCVRIRLTLAASREEAKDASTADALRARAKECFPPELPRF